MLWMLSYFMLILPVVVYVLNVKPSDWEMITWET